MGHLSRNHSTLLLTTALALAGAWQAPRAAAQDAPAAPAAAAEATVGQPAPAATAQIDATTAAAPAEASVSADATTEAAPAAEPAPAAAARTEAPPAPPATQPTAEQVPPPVAALAQTADAEESPMRFLQAKANMMSRYEMRKGYNELGRTHPRFRNFDAVAYRARLTLYTTPLDIGKDIKVSFQLAPHAAGFWAAGTNSGGLAPAAFGMHEGFLKIGVRKSWLQVGRFEMNYGDQLMIGAVGWHENGRSFDGARAHLSFNGKGPWLDLFVTPLSEGRTGDVGTTNWKPVGSGDLLYVGAYAGLGPMFEAKLDWDLYMLSRAFFRTDDLGRDDSATPPPATTKRNGALEATFGTRVKGKQDFFDYRIEAGLQAGARTTATSTIGVLAYQGDAELGAKFADGIARIALEAAYASGDDPSTTDKNESWFDGFSTAHKWLGLMDVFGLRSNVFAGTLHGSVKATDSGKIGLQAHALMRPQQLNAAGTDGEFKFVGGEIDIYGVYNIAKGLSLRPDYGVFIPTTDGYGAGSDAAHMLMIQLQYKGG